MHPNIVEIIAKVNKRRDMKEVCLINKRAKYFKPTKIRLILKIILVQIKIREFQRELTVGRKSLS